MIKLYRRLTRGVTSINQLNRVHIALENSLTPLQWFKLQSDLSASLKEIPSERENEYHVAQKNWIKQINEMCFVSGIKSPQLFKREAIKKFIKLFKGASKNKKLLVCFTGLAQRMMVPLPSFLQHVNSNEIDVLLITYPKKTGFRSGLKGSTNSFDDFIEDLNVMIQTSQYDEIFSIGVSGGGLPAILCALKLNFEAAISFSGGNPEDVRWTEALGYKLEKLIETYLNKNRSKPILTLVYGEDSQDDMLAAKRTAELLKVQKVVIRSNKGKVGHVSLYPLMMAGKLISFLENALFQAKRQNHLKANHKLTALTGPRYFCIGFNKTGTTTIGRSFEILKLTPIAEPRSPYMNFIELSHKIFEDNNFMPALETAQYFRAFQDRPWNIWDIYEKLDKHFPGSFFILTERDEESWWQSVEKWLVTSNKSDREKFERYLKHLKLTSLNKDEFIEAYINYNKKVKEYFKGRDNFIIMNLEKGDGWEKLCNFLKLPKPDVPFPHANRQI
jgi:hypothetical protein